MSPLVCELHCRSNALHLQHLFTGFAALARSGLIELRQTALPAAASDPLAPAHLRDARTLAHLEVVLNGNVRLYYDAHDSWEIDAAKLDACDLYFKRSYSAAHLRGLRHHHKVLPLGMLYNVRASWPDRYALARVLAFERRPAALAAGLLRTLDTRNRFTFAPRVESLAALPDLNAPPAALFMARAWDPDGFPELPLAKRQEFERLNDVRAQCIRLLRRELTTSFCGGFANTDFARRRYPDCLVGDAAMTDQRHYLERLRRYPIGIGTQGLHGSTGFKLAEYVCCAKAVVTESPTYEAPGEFSANFHYLPFESPEECVSQTVRLFTDRELRQALMINNAHYYQTHLRPDAMVLNTLLAALPHALNSGAQRAPAAEAVLRSAAVTSS
jgi:hypothetical protein